MKIFFIPFWLDFSILIAETKSYGCLGLSCPSWCGLQEKGSQASVWILLEICHPWEERHSCLSPMVRPWQPHMVVSQENAWIQSRFLELSFPLPHGQLWVLALFLSSGSPNHSDYQGPAMVVAFPWSITVASQASTDWKLSPQAGIHTWQEVKALHCLWEPCLHLICMCRGR